MMIARGASYCILNYLDDYVGVSGTKEHAADTLNIMIDTCRHAGFKVQDTKTISPARCLEFLGVEIDTIAGQLKVSEDRMKEIKDLLDEWMGNAKCTKWELLSLIGKLSFCGRVVRSGNKFLRRLIELSKKAKNLHFKLTLTHQAKCDIK